MTVATGVWEPQAGPQNDAYYCAADILFYGGQAGGGKCLEYNAYSLIWRSSGNKIHDFSEGEIMILQSKDIRVGDHFPGSNGKPTEIIYKTEPKTRAFYRVTFSDGSSIDVSDNHNWTMFDLSKRAKGDKERGNFQKIMTTTEILAEGLRYHRQKRFAIPLVSSPIDMPNSVKPDLPPYALGYWLGNGWSQGAAFTCHTDDREDMVKLLSESLGRELEWRQYEKDA